MLPGVNTAPVAAPDSYTTPEDTALVVPAAAGLLADDADADGDRLTAALAAGPANGTVTVNPDGRFTYTPKANFNGTDSFTYTVGDGKGGTAAAVVTITVTPVNDPPVAVNDTFSTTRNTPLAVAGPGVLANDTDVDGDPLAAVLVRGPRNGVLALLPDGSVTYTPGPGSKSTVPL